MADLYTPSFEDSPKSNQRSKVIQTVFLLAVVAAIGVAVYLFTASLRQVNDHVARTDDLTWNITQLENDLKSLQLSIADAQLTTSPKTLLQVRQRFDILYSRIQMLTDGAFDRFPMAQASLQGILAQHDLFLDRNIPLIDGPDAALAIGLPNLKVEVQNLTTITHTGVLKVAQDIYTQQDAHRAQLRDSFYGFSLGAFLLVTLLFFTIIAALFLLAQQRWQTVALGRISANLRATFETSQDAVVVLDEDGKLLEFNSAATQTLGLTWDNVQNNGFAQLIRDYTQDDAVAKQIAQAREAQKAHIGDGRPVRMDCLHADGRLVPLEVVIGLAQSAGGRKLLIGFGHDISERIAREESLRTARNDALKGEQAKARFLAVMSHELRTPLNGIIAGVELMRDTTVLDDRQEWLTGILQSCGQSALEQVNNLLELTRLGADESPDLPKAAFYIQDLVERAVKQVRPQANARDNQLIIKTPSDPIPPVLGSEQLFNHVLINLLSNAIKFTRNGQVTISLSAKPSDTNGTLAINLAVADTGIGIAEQDLGRIFENFETLDGSYTRNNDGTGLGLGIVQRAARAMGGDVQVQSTLGQGSVFTVSVIMPIADSPQQAAAKDGQVGPSYTDLKNLHVLVAEDNDVNRLIIKEILKTEGVKVAEAIDGQDAVNYALSNASKLDVILMDISMPRMDGLTATQILRADPQTRNIPIIGVTAHALDDQIEGFISSGIDAVVIKPISKEILLKSLCQLKGGRGGQGQAQSVHGRANTHDLIDRDTFSTLQMALPERDIQGHISQFVQDAHAVAQQIEQDLLSGDYDQAARAAHKLAGTAAVLGAAGVHQLLRQFESNIKSRDLTKTDTLPGALRSDVIAAASAMQALVKKPA